MTILTIILSSTDIVRLSINSISIYRISLLATLLMTILFALKSGRIKNGKYLYFVFLLVISSPISYIISTNKQWAFSFLLNDYMGIILIFIINNNFNLNDLKLLLKAFIKSQIFTILCSVYSVFMYYIHGGILQEINFLGIFNINLSEEFLARATSSGEVRLSLPYATPSHLSIIMAITICILLFGSEIFSKKLRFLLITIFSVLLILTGSRTGIIAIVIVFLFISIMNFNYTINISKTIIVTTIILVGAVFMLITNLTYIDKFANRFIIEDILQDRHLLVPIEGILIWLTSIKNFLIGIGYGSSINMTGKFTYLPPYFLNSYVTLVAEKGMLGLLMLFEFIRLFIKSLRSIKTKSLAESGKAIYYSYYIILVSFIFYEAKQNIGVWVIIAIILMLDNNHNKDMEE